MTNKLKEILSEEEVKNFSELIKNLENSSFDYFKVENENLQIVIAKEGIDVMNSVSTAAPTPQLVAAPPKTSTSIEQKQIVKEVAASTQGETIEKTSVDEMTETDGIVQVKALTAGIFYAQSEPGAPPYIKLGDQVNEDSTLGLVEIMKVYSAIVAGVKGEVVGIHVESGQLIEYGQLLFSVKTN
ncbi:acetyl-CoA carboxylase biotin carboxyl carrier protein [Rummeliibacillus sp. NPDC094406]|uniref:acetyl-CoA carboxylase biotin carboxyl carrier protein n=1 Tax=Rummeliibacillus sp. NPDC094406 TaxID=3364511 RepID=UPI0037F8DB42